jgi:hypothetical protein
MIHVGPSWLILTLAIALEQLRLTLPSNVVADVVAVAPAVSVTVRSNRGLGADPSTPRDKRTVDGRGTVLIPSVTTESRV